MACPYFFPTEKSSTIGWAFPARLPLGAGFNGTCRAGAEEITPADTEIRDFCNLGYACGCARMPVDRPYDCVRFAIARDEDSRITLHYISERGHEPVEHGRLEYDCASRQWPSPLRDVRMQRQAECYLAVYLERKGRRSDFAAD